MERQVLYHNWGKIEFEEAWELQAILFKEIISQKVQNRNTEERKPTQSHLIVCEHPHVYTIGKSGSASHLLADAQRLEELGAKFIKIDRGGDITYHGPGQLVVYPILDLDNFFTDLGRYLRTLEEAVVLTLREYGLYPGRIEGLTGVWIDGEDNEKARKICAMGLRSSRWVTMHGLALNINTDLSYFSHIVPCGIEGKDVTSLARELHQYVDMNDVADKLKFHLGELFQAEFIDVK